MSTVYKVQIIKADILIKPRVETINRIPLEQVAMVKLKGSKSQGRRHEDRKLKQETRLF